MSNASTRFQGVMEGKGAYNKYAKLPAGGAALALPLLERAASGVTLATGDQPVVVADYGSSQGKNSLVPVKVALRILRDRLGATRPIFVFHIDQSSNDFNSLFEILAADPDRYAVSDPYVYPAAIGRSFYEMVLPPASVGLGWCSYAAVWLSRLPTLIPGHFIALRGTDTVRAEFARQAAQDWEAFLALRAAELCEGGRLVVVLPALTDDGLSGFESIMDHANATLAEMVADGTITTEERERMALRAYPRRKSSLLAPFARQGHFQHLGVEDFEMSVLPDQAWNEFEQDGNKELLAAKHAMFFRAVFVPSLACALTSVRAGDADALHNFGNRLEEGLKRRVAGQPRAMHSFVQTIVFVKRA